MKMNEEHLRCPRCERSNLECQELGVKYSRWKVTFGRKFFGKHDIVGYACRDCGFVFLQLKEFGTQ
jgi:transposase-like protein